MEPSAMANLFHLMLLSFGIFMAGQEKRGVRACNWILPSKLRVQSPQSSLGGEVLPLLWRCVCVLGCRPRTFFLRSVLVVLSWWMILTIFSRHNLKTSLTIRHDRLVPSGELARQGIFATQVEVPLEDLKRPDAFFHLPGY